MSFEEEIKEQQEKDPNSVERLNLPFLKYFWQSGPLYRDTESSLPQFLRGIHILDSFTENELRILSKLFHLRKFEPKEVIFNQGDAGFGFYLILNGEIEIWARGEDEVKGSQEQLIVKLSRSQYFGELALLQKNSMRTASAVSRGHSTLLGIFKPDIESLLNNHPVVGSKLIFSLSTILANRISALNSKISELTSVLDHEKRNKA